MPQPILGMELREIEEALGPAQPRYRARQVYEAVYHRQVPDLVDADEGAGVGGGEQAGEQGDEHDPMLRRARWTGNAAAR